MPFDPVAALAILFGLQLKHFVFDFVFQSDWQVRNKGRYGHPGGLVHAGLHGLGTLGVMMVAVSATPLAPLLALQVALADYVIHYHVDFLKARLSRRLRLTPDRHGFWIALGADQAAHHATYLGLVAFIVLTVA